MKILFLSHKFYPHIGGIETISEILAGKFSEAGHEVHLLTWSKDTDKKFFPYSIKRNPGMMQLFKEHLWADLVFENNPCLRLSWPRLITGRPGVIGLQTWLTKANGTIEWHEKLKLKWLKRTKRIIACSKAIQRKCWPDSVIIGNPYKEDQFKVNCHVTKKKDFVFVGRLVAEKGVLISIKAFNSLLSGNHLLNSTLTVVGDGPERMALEAMVNSLALQEKIFFKGTLRDKALAECLNEHRFLLVPSMWEEPFGIVALEGMACGCVPIVSDGGGLPDAVGNAGITFKSGSAQDLSACMQKLLGNSVLEHKLQLAAKTHLNSFHSEVVAQKYLRILEEAVKIPIVSKRKKSPYGV